MDEVLGNTARSAVAAPGKSNFETYWGMPMTFNAHRRVMSVATSLGPAELILGLVSEVVSRLV